LPEPRPPLHALTDDTLFQGGLICRQGRDGYRFSVDAVLAAHFCLPKPGAKILDLGCGCGVIGLILAYRHPQITVRSLELQEQLATLAQENGDRNGFTERFRVFRGDLCAIGELLEPESFDLVVCNPPYRKKDSGRINQDDQAACARHELTATVDDFVRASAFCVKNRGRVVFVYPATRANTLLTSLQQHRLTLKRLQPVYSYPGTASARLVLIEAMKNGGEQSEILAPLYIYEHKNGGYSPAMCALYRE
jgi:tRNA1(Val) A37 N6-methylase TrmN6